MPKKRLIAVAVPIILSLTSCGGSDDGAGSSDTTTDDAGSDSLVVTWDGTDCVYDGPAEVTAGAVAVDYANNGEDRSNLWVYKLDGITAQDVMDLNTTEQDPHLINALPETLDMGGVAPPDPGETVEWEKDLAPGEYVLICASSRPPGIFNVGSGLIVVEA